MPPIIDPNGPYRKWYDRESLIVYDLFTESDIVWWTQQNTDFPAPAYPGYGINEGLCRWWYEPQTDQDPDLLVEYNTYLNQRYGKFIFHASFLTNGAYTIFCILVDAGGQEYPLQWDVRVLHP